MKKFIFTCCFIFIWINNSFAFEIQDEGFLPDDFPKLKVDSGYVSWDVFSTTKEIEKCEERKNGFSYCFIRPVYSEQIKKLDNTKVKLMGFMFPLDNTDKQKKFLIGPYPLSCPFHFHTKPSLVVEVVSKKPIDFSYDPIKLEGTLSLKYNEETGVFYYLILN